MKSGLWTPTYLQKFLPSLSSCLTFSKQPCRLWFFLPLTALLNHLGWLKKLQCPGPTQTNECQHLCGGGGPRYQHFCKAPEAENNWAEEKEQITTAFPPAAWFVNLLFLLKNSTQTFISKLKCHVIYDLYGLMNIRANIFSRGKNKWVKCMYCKSVSPQINFH